MLEESLGDDKVTRKVWQLCRLRWRLVGPTAAACRAFAPLHDPNFPVPPRSFHVRHASRPVGLSICFDARRMIADSVLQ